MIKEILTFAAKFLDFWMNMTSKEKKLEKKRNEINSQKEKKKEQIDRAVSKKKTGDINDITADVINRHDDSDSSLPGKT